MPIVENPPLARALYKRVSVLVFDELSDDIFPGETLAVNEVLGLRNLRLQRFPMTARVSYCVIE